MQYANDWEIKTIDSHENLEAHALLPLLATNRIAAIRISNFFTRKELDTAVKNINQRDISWYQNSEHRQGRIGISATEYHSKTNGKLLYFVLAPKCSRIREDMFSGASDPIQKIIGVFSKSYKVSVAHEPDDEGVYFAGLIRAMGAKSTLHFDYAPHQLPGWGVSESEEQFALVLYLQMPADGGGLLIYNRPWVSEDDIHNEDIFEKGPNGFNPTFLESERPTRISPVTGDLIIFRSRNFHQVEGIDSDQIRLTFNSFLTLKNDVLSLWS